MQDPGRDCDLDGLGDAQGLDGLDGLEGFDGTVPCFPLPDLVFFPCTLLPLHIFEPRYRQMVEDALAGPRLIAMVKLRAGWERAGDDPPAHDVACIGKIVEHFRHPDGRFHIVLCGVRRARLLGFVDRGTPYKVARTDLVCDGALAGREPLGRSLCERVLRAVAALPARALRHKNLGLALRKLDAPLGAVTDLVADSLRIEPALKQRLLEQPDPVERARCLIDWANAEAAIHRGAVLAAAAAAAAEPTLN